MNRTKVAIKYITTFVGFYLIFTIILKANGIIVQNWDEILMPIWILITIGLLLVIGLALMCILITKIKF